MDEIMVDKHGRELETDQIRKVKLIFLPNFTIFS